MNEKNLNVYNLVQLNIILLITKFFRHIGRKIAVFKPL